MCRWRQKPTALLVHRQRTAAVFDRQPCFVRARDNQNSACRFRFLCRLMDHIGHVWLVRTNVHYYVCRLTSQLGVSIIYSSRRNANFVVQRRVYSSCEKINYNLLPESDVSWTHLQILDTFRDETWVGVFFYIVSKYFLATIEKSKYWHWILDTRSVVMRRTLLEEISFRENTLNF